MATPSLFVDHVITEFRLIYWLLPGMMCYLQVIALAIWYFIAPEFAVNQTFTSTLPRARFEVLSYGEAKPNLASMYMECQTNHIFLNPGTLGGVFN